MRLREPAPPRPGGCRHGSAAPPLPTPAARPTPEFLEPRGERGRRRACGASGHQRAPARRGAGAASFPSTRQGPARLLLLKKCALGRLVQNEKKKVIYNINATAGSFSYHRLRHVPFGMRNAVPRIRRTPALTRVKELGAKARLCKAGRERAVLTPAASVWQNR